MSTSHTLPIGQPLERYSQVGSTNTMLRERARAGAAEGLVLLADEQVAGRGRLGRGWSAPPGSSLLMSLLLRPAWLPTEQAFLLTMLAAVSLCEAAEQVAPGLRAALKWPNDLLLPATPAAEAPWRKAAGILTELAVEQGRIAYAIIGMGVNVNWSPSGVVDGNDLAARATSFAAATGQPAERETLLQALLARLNTRYRALHQGQQQALFQDWRGRLATLGQQVTVNTPTGSIHGLAEDVDLHGSLRLRTSAGVQVITAGDVSA